MITETAVEKHTELDRFNAGVPGVYRNIPNAVYHALDAFSRGRAYDMRRCPAWCKWKMEHPDKSEALLIGGAVDAGYFSPDTFGDHYVAAPVCDRRTGVGKATYAKFQTASVGREVLTTEQADTVARCINAVRADDELRRLLQGDGDSQLSILWIDRDTGLLCRSRPDKHGLTRRALIDLKTSKSAAPDDFAASVFRFGYELQAGLYTEGALEHGLDIDEFIFSVVEKDEPNLTASYSMDMSDIVRGVEELKPIKETYAECKQSGVWPGYTKKTQRLELPRWARNKLDEQAGDL